jgi:ATP-binding protein involved in chromosome partitioning
VTSGKGGVGKSYVTAGLAEALGRRLGGGVGVLDADLKGPTTARMLGASGPVRVDENGVHPAQGRTGVKVFSMDLLLEEGQPLRWKEPPHEGFVWRGTLEMGALREFLADVAWGRLDLLLVDLPPEADALEHLAELVPDLAGAVAVTIPSAESRRSVARAMRAAVEAGVRLLGVVENMSGYACPGCGETGPLFTGQAGDALAAEFGIPVLARLPFQPAPGASPPSLGSLAEALLARLP